MTYVKIIKNCLDSGITSKRNIFYKLKEAFPAVKDANNWIIYKYNMNLWCKINPTITYIKSKIIKKDNSIELELGIKISGVADSQEQQNLLYHYLKLILVRTDLKLPGQIIWSNTSRSVAYSSTIFGLSSSKIKLSKKKINIGQRLLGVLLHELVHTNGYWGHQNKFYNKLREVGIKCELDLDKWFSREYIFGQRYHKRYSNK